MVIQQPPAEFGVAFLDWLRARTEQVWAHLRMGPVSDFARRSVLGPCWQRGTRWTGGLSDPSIQARYGVWFPPQHRVFLQTLHSTSPWMRSADYARYGDQLALRVTPGFTTGERTRPRSVPRWPLSQSAFSACCSTTCSTGTGGTVANNSARRSCPGSNALTTAAGANPS